MPQRYIGQLLVCSRNRKLALLETATSYRKLAPLLACAICCAAARAGILTWAEHPSISAFGGSWYRDTEVTLAPAST